MLLRLSRLGVVAALLALAGCAAPAQYDGLIPVDNAGLQRRLRILCRLGVGDATARAGCAAPLDQALRRQQECGPDELSEPCRQAGARPAPVPASGPAKLSSPR